MGKFVASHRGHNVVWSLVFTPDGKGLLSGSRDDGILQRARKKTSQDRT